MSRQQIEEALAALCVEPPHAVEVKEEVAGLDEVSKGRLQEQRRKLAGQANRRPLAASPTRNTARRCSIGIVTPSG
jgi:hypothetical protein